MVKSVPSSIRLPSLKCILSIVPSKGALISVSETCTWARARSAFASSSFASAISSSVLETMFLSASVFVFIISSSASFTAACAFNNSAWYIFGIILKSTWPAFTYWPSSTLIVSKYPFSCARTSIFRIDCICDTYSLVKDVSAFKGLVAVYFPVSSFSNFFVVQLVL